jgi:hypothetical protein
VNTARPVARVFRMQFMADSRFVKTSARPVTQLKSFNIKRDALQSALGSEPTR